MMNRLALSVLLPLAFAGNVAFADDASAQGNNLHPTALTRYTYVCTNTAAHSALNYNYILSLYYDSTPGFVSTFATIESGSYRNSGGFFARSGTVFENHYEIDTNGDLGRVTLTLHGGSTRLVGTGAAALNGEMHSVAVSCRGAN